MIERKKVRENQKYDLKFFNQLSSDYITAKTRLISLSIY